MLTRVKSVVVGLVAAGLAGCASRPPRMTQTPEGPRMTYEVKRLTRPMKIDADWDKAAWRNVPAVRIDRYMGARPEHIPGVQAKLLYDDHALYAIFRVEDRYVRAVAPRHQAAVCKDSCVEFFFTPGQDVSKGYFNIEMNCGGTMLFHFQIVPRKNPVEVPAADLERIEVAHTMPRIVDPEIQEPTVWTVEYRVPLDILPRFYLDARMPAPGVTWRANFYKCADATSHPHWLMWAPIELPRPDFHQPRWFGVLEFQ